MKFMSIVYHFLEFLEKLIASKLKIINEIYLYGRGLYKKNWRF